MSLLGRLEDLSLPDIVQIVFLSRRTGILEIIDGRGRHTVLFRHGLIVNASSPDAPYLSDYLLRTETLSRENYTLIKQMEESGVSTGRAILEMNIMTMEALAEQVRERVTGVVTPLLASRDGEFNFILSELIGELDIEYDPDALFPEGGIAPMRLISSDGEKVKPLSGLEESMRVGKALRRGSSTPPPAASPPLDLALGQPEMQRGLTSPPVFDDELEELEADEAECEVEADHGPAPIVSFSGSEGSSFGDVSEGVDEVTASLGSLLPAEPATEPAHLPPFPDEVPLESLTPPAALQIPPESAASQDKTVLPFARFRITADAEQTGESHRTVVLFERDAMIRVAAKRAFGKKGVQVYQFGSIEDTRNSVQDMLRKNRFFVTFLELAPSADGGENESALLLATIKKRNRHLPVVMIDGEASLRRRHDLLKAGADLYLTKPSEDHLQPGMAEEELALFADELVLFSERAFSSWTQIAGALSAGAGGSDLAETERINRSHAAVKMLINELSNPNDISQVGLTILRLAAEYLDRAVLFVATPTEFVGLGGFGETGDGAEVNSRARKFKIARAEPSILSDVASSRQAHFGKLRKTTANMELINRLGVIKPTEVAVMPILHRDDVVGLMYGDNAVHRGPIEKMAGLEIFLQQAGFALQNAVIASSRRQSLNQEGP